MRQDRGAEECQRLGRARLWRPQYRTAVFLCPGADMRPRTSPRVHVFCDFTLPPSLRCFSLATKARLTRYGPLPAGTTVTTLC